MQHVIHKGGEYFVTMISRIPGMQFTSFSKQNFKDVTFSLLSLDTLQTLKVKATISKSKCAKTY